jgi:hypothetical protein
VKRVLQLRFAATRSLDVRHRRREQSGGRHRAAKCAQAGHKEDFEAFVKDASLVSDN